MGRPRKHFAAVGSEEVLANPEEAGTRAVLCFAIDRIITERKLTQTEAARVMGVPQPTVSRLRGYQVEEFSVERLMRLLTALGQDVVIEIRPRAKKKDAGRVRVVTHIRDKPHTIKRLRAHTLTLVPSIKPAKQNQHRA